MIEYIKGRLTEITPTYAIVETPAGIAFELIISLYAYTTLSTAKGGEVKVLAHEVVREDAWILYGFLDERERELFRQLISVSGVGANTARLIISAIQPDELGAVIASGNLSRLKAVKGIGTKTAQRIIVDLKDKINSSDSTLINQVETTLAPDSAEVQEEALAALVMLGFTRPQSQKALSKIFGANPATRVEDAIKQALAMM